MNDDACLRFSFVVGYYLNDDTGLRYGFGVRFHVGSGMGNFSRGLEGVLG